MDLVICNTPFQVIQIKNLITNNIIKKGDFYFLYIPNNKSEQMRYYYKMLDCESLESDFIVMGKSKLKDILSIFKLKFIFLNKKFNNVFFASIDSVLIHNILSSVSFNEINTIDDGTANIFNESSYKDIGDTKKRLIFNKILFVKYNKERIKEDIAIHYSIYENYTNIVDNVKYIPLFNNDNRHEVSNNEEVNVFIGTVYPEFNNDYEIIIERLYVFFKNKTVFYIKHPRDDSDYFENFDIIDSLDVAEMKILNLLKYYSKVNIYGFGSTVQVNLIGNNRVNNYILTNELIKIDDFFSNENNIEKVCF